MFEHLQRLIKHSAVYGMTETVSRGIGFVLVFIYARLLTDTEIGIRSSIYSTAALLGIVYTLGLDNAFLRYYMDEEFENKKEEVFSTAFYFSTFIGVFFLAAAMLYSEPLSFLLTKSSSFEYITRLIFIILIFDTIVIYPTLILRAENRLVYFSLIALARFILFIFMNLTLVWMIGRGLKGVFEANFIVVILLSILLLPVYRNYLRLRISPFILKRMLIFGIPTIFTVLCMRVIDFSDRFVILYLLGEKGAAELGGYSVAYTLGMVGIMVFVNSFRLAWQPFFLSHKNNPDAGNLFSRVATYYSIFIGFVFLGITLFRREIFALYASKNFKLSLSEIVPFVSCAYIFFGFYIIMLAGIFIREKTKVLPLVTFTGAALNLGLNFIFVPVFGVIGAAYTTVIAYVSMVIFMYIISRRVYRVHYEFKRLGVVFVLTGFPILLSCIFQPDGNVIWFFYRCILCMIPVAVYLFSGFLFPEERKLLRRLFHRYCLRNG